MLCVVADTGAFEDTLHGRAKKFNQGPDLGAEGHESAPMEEGPPCVKHLFDGSYDNLKGIKFIL